MSTKVVLPLISQVLKLKIGVNMVQLLHEMVGSFGETCLAQRQLSKYHVLH